MQPRTRVLTLAFLSITCFPASSALAQTNTTGTIEGVVIDQNRAVVPGVTLIVSSPNLIRTQSSTTNSEGQYRILNLPPGKYVVTIEGADLRNQIQKDHGRDPRSSRSPERVTLGAALIPHATYGDNEGFAVQRGTAINPLTRRSRTPTTYNVDLGASYPVRFTENMQLRIQVDWFNVTNVQRAIRQDETLRTNSGIPGAQSIQFPNPSYGQGTIFNIPLLYALE